MQAQALHPTESAFSYQKAHVKVLLVEDEALFARAVVGHLKQAGYDCEHADTLAGGQALARQFMPDIPLLDMRLPDDNGLELITELPRKAVSCLLFTTHENGRA